MAGTGLLVVVVGDFGVEVDGSVWDGGGNGGTPSRAALDGDDDSLPDCPPLHDLKIFVGDFGRLDVVLTGATSCFVITLKIARFEDKSALVNSGFCG